MPSFKNFIVSTALVLATLGAAKSGCRCGDPAYLAIPRVNTFTAEQSKACAAHKLVDARGSGEPQGVSLMFQDVIERLIANSTDTVSQSVIYPAGFDQNVTSGVQNTVDIITQGLQGCPNQTYALFGYSQGATVVQEALGQLNASLLAAVNAVVLVGNPYRIPGRLSNVDADGHHDNRTAYGLFSTQSLSSNASIQTYDDDLDHSGKVVDICLENDIVCAFDPECTCQLASDHLSYGLMKSVQDMVFEHIVTRLPSEF